MVSRKTDLACLRKLSLYHRHTCRVDAEGSPTMRQCQLGSNGFNPDQLTKQSIIDEADDELATLLSE